MRKILTILKREYLVNVRRPAFLASTFLLPIFLVGSMFLGGALGAAGDGVEEIPADSILGYVDASGVMTAGLMPPDVIGQYVPYESLEAAQAAIDAGEIGGYFELPETYLEIGAVTLYSIDKIPDVLKTEIAAVIAVNLAGDMELPLPLDRIRVPVDDLTIRDLTTGRDLSGDSVFLLFLLPFVFGLLLIMSSLTTSSFLMFSLVEEKSNRIVEILVTSVKPLELLTGKILGLGLLGLTQIVIILTMAFIGLTIASALDFIQGLTLPWDIMVLCLVYFVLSYLILAAVLAGLGVLVGSEQESSQISGLMTLPFFIPFFFMFSILMDPNGPAAVILSLIPFTAPMTIVLRMGLTTVPLWQIGLSIALMAVTAVFFIWLSARVFRWGLLLYGKKFDIRNLFRALLRRGGSQISAAQTPQEVVS